MDGQVSISTQYQDGQEAIDELKDLLFELGYVQMHTSEQNTQQIFHKVATIIQLLNDFEQEGMHKQKALPQFYAQLSTELFSIVAILKEDLYGKTANTIDLQHVKELLESCNLFLDSQEVDKYELQNYFWDEVQDQLLSLGHEFTKKDFTADVSQYYARSRNRYRYYGLEFPIYRLKDGTIANFKLELGDELYYGLFKSEKDESNPIIEQAVQNIIGFNISSYWFAWKFFDRNRLNFWSLNSEGIERLKHPRRREKLIREIAEELDLYIKKIQNELQHIEQEEPTK
ncbi:hypothetical protein RYD26_00180 [Pasteurellaceae bacterium LIM206]|nr:hypothetical protein [Pasteurellaceae bacterium LIM206]